MTVANKNIIDTYSKMFDGLTLDTKHTLIERLSKSLKSEKNKDKEFFDAFGSFPTDRPAEEILHDIKASRRFREKDIQL